MAQSGLVHERTTRALHVFLEEHVAADEDSSLARDVDEVSALLVGRDAEILSWDASCIQLALVHSIGDRHVDDAVGTEGAESSELGRLLAVPHLVRRLVVGVGLVRRAVVDVAEMLCGIAPEVRLKLGVCHEDASAIEDVTLVSLSESELVGLAWSGAVVGDQLAHQAFLGLLASDFSRVVSAILEHAESLVTWRWRLSGVAGLDCHLALHHGHLVGKVVLVLHEGDPQPACCLVEVVLYVAVAADGLGLVFPLSVGVDHAEDDRAARLRGLLRVRKASDLGQSAHWAPVVAELFELVECDLDAHVDALVVHDDHLVGVHVPEPTV